MREQEDHVALLVFFPVGQLSPRGVRRRFIDSLRIAIARACVAREMDTEICEELWRALPRSERA